MHPAGIKFGLSQGLLEFRGADVVVSGPFLENLSEMARRKIRKRKRVMRIWDEVLASGLRKTPYSLTGVPRREFTPFYTGYERVVLISMMPIAERIQMGRRLGPRYFIAEGMLERLSKVRRSFHAATLNEYWRIRFRQIYCITVGLCRQYAPEHFRHAELLSLCQFNSWQTDRENEIGDAFVRSLFRKYPGDA